MLLRILKASFFIYSFIQKCVVLKLSQLIFIHVQLNKGLLLIFAEHVY